MGMKHLQKQKEKKEQEENRRIIEMKQREQKRKEFAPKVQQSNLLVDNSKKLEQKRKDDVFQKKEEVRIQTQNYKKWVKQVKGQVNERPLLCEQDTRKDKKIQQMKAVVTYIKTLQESGLSKRRINEVITQDQKNLYEDYLYLSKNGYKDIFSKQCK